MVQSYFRFVLVVRSRRLCLRYLFSAFATIARGAHEKSKMSIMFFAPKIYALIQILQVKQVDLSRLTSLALAPATSSLEITFSLRSRVKDKERSTCGKSRECHEMSKKVYTFINHSSLCTLLKIVSCTQTSVFRSFQHGHEKHLQNMSTNSFVITHIHNENVRS